MSLLMHLYPQADVFMHLTNYAINKHSEKFVRDDEEAGSKRCVPMGGLH